MARYEESPAEGWPRWMQRQITEADFVLAVCTPAYRKRFDGTDRSASHATWESLLATQLIHDQGARNDRIVPVLLDASPMEPFPCPCGP